MLSPEAKFYLAKDFSRNSERQYEKSIRLFGELQQQFPHNPLWPVLIGSLHFRMGNAKKGRGTLPRGLSNNRRQELRRG